MSQSLLYHAFGVREGYEDVKTRYVEGRVEFHLAVKEEKLVCSECGAGPAMRRGTLVVFDVVPGRERRATSSGELRSNRCSRLMRCSALMRRGRCRAALASRWYFEPKLEELRGWVRHRFFV